MLTVITNYSDKNLDSLEEYFLKYKKSPFHTLNCIRSKLLTSKKEKTFLVSYKKEDKYICSLFNKKSEDIWACFFQEEAFIASPSINVQDLQLFLFEICERLRISNIYFPLIYENSKSYHWLIKLSNMSYLERLPSPFIHWNIDNSPFTEYLYNNSRRKIDRLWKRFDKNLIYKQVQGWEAVKLLESIEKKSWKYEDQQSMFHRDNQFEFYKSWLNSKEIYLQTALDKSTNEGVAFRIDARLKTKIYTLKYSYDENYKKFSPGFCLLTQGLYRLWKDQGIQEIDLWGSPDTLKNSIKAGEINRYDFFWPNSSSNQELLNERKAFDTKISKHTAAGGSLKNLNGNVH